MLIHPPFTGFPVVLLSLCMVGKILYWKKGSEFWRAFLLVNLRVCLIMTTVTYFSGYFTPIPSEFPGQNTLSNHQTLAKLSFIAIFVTNIMYSVENKTDWAKRYVPCLQTLSLLLSFTLVVVTSYWGGMLVFTHGAGVRLP